MNDALKLLSKSLKPFGYHISRYKGPNILKMPNGEEAPLKTFRKATYQTSITSDANLDHLIVYLRTCMRTNRNIDTRPRLTGNDLVENTIRCVNSLVKSMNAAQSNGKITLTVLDDRSDKEPLEKLKAVLSAAEFDWSLETTKTAGQGASLYEQFARGKDQNAILYFCEDDYLHEENGITAMWNFYRHIASNYKTHCVIYPQEHADLHDGKHYPSYILAGTDRHWRTINHATHTLFMHSHIIRDNWQDFENTKFVGIKKKRKLGSEAKTTNKLFKKYPGFSPITPAAVHLQFEALLPPFYDWKPLWEENKVKIGA